MHAWLYESIQYEIKEKSIWMYKSGRAKPQCLPMIWQKTGRTTARPDKIRFAANEFLGPIAVGLLRRCGLLLQADRGCNRLLQTRDGVWELAGPEHVRTCPAISILKATHSPGGSTGMVRMSIGCTRCGCTLSPPGEYDWASWTVRVRRRCGRTSNCFDHLFHCAINRKIDWLIEWLVDCLPDFYTCQKTVKRDGLMDPPLTDAINYACGN